MKFSSDDVRLALGILLRIFPKKFRKVEKALDVLDTFDAMQSIKLKAELAVANPGTPQPLTDDEWSALNLAFDKLSKVSH